MWWVWLRVATPFKWICAQLILVVVIPKILLNWVISCADNGVSPILHKPNIEHEANLLSIGSVHVQNIDMFWSQCDKRYAYILLLTGNRTQMMLNSAKVTVY